jgi:eukaryotic-like serine/threonine-protein kinase
LPTLAEGRLVVRAPLGAGGAGHVYRALDRARGHEVAVKVLHDPTADALVRLKTEFRALADLRHPNLVRLHELIDDGGHWMITMELVDGVDFLRWVRPVPTADGADGLLDETRLRGAAIELARGLEALHVAGYLHRDIKPSNVVVTDGGRVVLLDGGLVASLVDGRQDEADVIAAGTLAYMAPEQGAGRRLTPKSDWYAAGALLYHALTGRPPFLGAPVEVISAKLLEEPPRPSTFVPGVAPDLDQLAVDLLHRRPRQRPSGREVIRRLGGVSDDELDLADGSGDFPLPLVGRERELGVIGPLLAKGWGPRLIVVTGPAGVGKSFLVREAIRRMELRRPEAWTVWNRTHPRTDVPLRGLDGLIDELAKRLRRLGDDQRRDLAPVLRRLARRFPVLATIARGQRGSSPPPPSGPPVGPPDPRVEAATVAPVVAPPPPAPPPPAPPPEAAPDPIGVGQPGDDAAALGELLATVGLERPLVMVMDDAHLARPAAIAFVHAALDAVPRPRVAFILIGRDDTDWWRGLPDAAVSLTLGELDQDDALAVAGQRVIPEDAPAVVASCGGHPGLITEVARAAADLAIWLGHRRGVLPARTRAVVDAIARSDVPLAPAVAARAAGVAPIEPAELDELATACVIKIGADGKLAPYHPRVGAAIAATLDDARRHELDRGLAAALVGAGEPLAAARRWLAAGERPQAREAAVRAANDAIAAGEHDHAIAAFQLAIAASDAAPDSRPPARTPERAAIRPEAPAAPSQGPPARTPERAAIRPEAPAASSQGASRPDLGAAGQLHAALAEVLGWTGRVDDAVRSYLAAAERSSPRRSLEARRRAGELLLHDGQLDAGAKVFAQLLDDLGVPALPRRGDHDIAPLIAQADEAGRDADPLTATRLDVLWAAATAWSEVDAARTARLRRIYVALARAAGDRRRKARALSSEAIAASARRHPDHAERWARAIAIAAEIGLAEDPAFTAGPAAYAALHAGELAAAAAGFDRVLTGLRERGLISGAAGAASLALALACRAHLGDLAGLRAVIDRVRSHASRDRMLGLEITTGGAALLGLAADDPDAVLAAAERAARWPSRGFTGISHQRVFAAWHAHVYRGDPAAARSEIEAGYAAARRAGVTLVAIARLDLLRMRALARVLTRDRDAAAHDRDRLAAIPLALAAPAADGVTAALAFAAGDRAAAATAWRRSAQALDKAGLVLHARAAAWRAALADGRPDAAAAMAAAIGELGVAAPEKLLATLAP